MNENRKFVVVRETEYGPVLKRVAADRGGFSLEEIPELDRVNSTDHNSFGDNVDFESEEPAEKVDLGRRRFLKTVGAAAASVLVSNLGEDLLAKGLPEDHKSISEVKEEDISSHEEIKEESMFEQEQSGYEALTHLRRDEVLFVDYLNRPVGEPQPLVSFVATKPGSGEGGNSDKYLYTPGKVNEAGIIEDGISGEWTSYVKKEYQAEVPEQKIRRMYHVTGDFRKAYEETDEPSLVAGIVSGEIEEYIDIVRYFADKPVTEKPSCTRKEYVRDEIEFTGIDTAAEEELRRLIPGLCAQESKFNAGSLSGAGAKGIMQFIPKTWEAYGGSLEDSTSISKQVEIAGKFISDLYRQIQNHIGEESITLLRNQFADDESFQVDFMVPSTINSYNAGAARVAEGVELYLKSINYDNLPSGKDLFVAIADYSKQSKGGKYMSGYGEHAREYVSRIYAQAKALD